MGFFKNIIESLKLNDDSDFDDYDDYDDYLAAEEEKERLKKEKKAQRDAEPKFSFKEALSRKKAPKQQPVEDEYYDDESYEVASEAPKAQRPSANNRTPLYDNNTVSIQERRSGYSKGTTTFEQRYKAKEAQQYRQQNPRLQTVPNEEPVVQQNTYRQPAYTAPASVAQPTTRDALGVTFIKPKSFEDASEICDILISGNPIIINFEGFDAQNTQRVMDFVCGCVYTINAEWRQVSNLVFLLTPRDIEVTGDFNSLMNQESMGVPTFNRR